MYNELSFFLNPIALSLSLLACNQACVVLVSTRPGRISAQEDFLPMQLEHLHIAQYKGQSTPQLPHHAAIRISVFYAGNGERLYLNLSVFVLSEFHTTGLLSDSLSSIKHLCICFYLTSSQTCMRTQHDSMVFFCFCIALFLRVLLNCTCMFSAPLFALIYSPISVVTIYTGFFIADIYKK